MPTPRVVCIGAAHWDLIGRARGPVAAGDDVPGRVVRRLGGVALNVASGLARAGVAVELVSAVGHDAAGEALLAEIAAAGIACSRIVRGATTDAYLAIEAGDGSLAAAVADGRALAGAGAAVIAPLRTPPVPPVVVADSNLGPGVLAALLAECAAARLVLVPASPHKAARLRPALARGGAAIVLNRAEAERLLDHTFADSRAAAAALHAAGAAEAIVTDGAAPATRVGPLGAVILAPPPGAGGVTGAGDAFTAALVAADLAGADPEAGLAAGLAAAGRHIRSCR